MAAERIDVSSIVASLAQIVRLHEGNRTPDINALLEQADEASAAVAELVGADREFDEATEAADGTYETLNRYEAAANRRRAALARVQGGA